MALSAKDLLKKKGVIEEKKDKKIEIEVPDLGTFLFRLPDLTDWLDAMAFAKNKDDRDADVYIIHACCLEPNLKDEELLKSYDCKMPTDIVDKIFLVGEVSSIAKALLTRSGFEKDAISIRDKVKN